MCPHWLTLSYSILFFLFWFSDVFLCHVFPQVRSSLGFSLLDGRCWWVNRYPFRPLLDQLMAWLQSHGRAGFPGVFTQELPVYVLWRGPEVTSLVSATSDVTSTSAASLHFRRGMYKCVHAGLGGHSALEVHAKRRSCNFYCSPYWSPSLR